MLSAAQVLFGPFPPCRHCRQKPAAPHKRGLCRRCYRTPEICVLYARLKFASYGEPPGDCPPPAEPTAAIPGTAEKLAVMRERAVRGEQVLHPHDATMDAAGRVRVPVLRNGKIVGWTVAAEPGGAA